MPDMRCPGHDIAAAWTAPPDDFAVPRLCRLENAVTRQELLWRFRRQTGSRAPTPHGREDSRFVAAPAANLFQGFLLYDICRPMI
jgi:hypothetical protein